MIMAAVGCSQPIVWSSAAGRQSITSCSNRSSGGLAWDPLQRSAILRGSLSTSASLVFRGGRVPEIRRRNISRRMLWRASRDEEAKPRCETEEQVHDSEGLLDKLADGLKSLASIAAKPAVIALMVGLLLAQPPEDAMAASTGGRMGGRVFKSAPAPGPSRSYSGGGGGGGGRIYSAPPIYGSPYGFSPFGFSPFSPFFGGYGYGGGLLVGPSLGFGGGGFLFFAMIAFVTLRAIAGFISDRFNDRDDFDD